MTLMVIAITYRYVSCDNGLRFVGEALACLAADRVPGGAVGDGGVGGSHGLLVAWLVWIGCLV